MAMLRLLRRIFAPGRTVARRKFAVCTLGTREYLPQVHALVESLRGHQPDAHVTFLYVAHHDEGPERPTLPGVEVIGVGDIVDGELERTLRRRYTIGELCFSLKPYLLRRMLSAHEAAIYLDADTAVHARFDAALEALETSFGALTPHIDVPLPEDGRQPNDMTMLRAGLYNAGFVALAAGQRALGFLDWWARRSTRWGFLAPGAGYHGDQGWLDLAPLFFPDITVLRDPGYNVGYWNLHSRKLRNGARPTANGRPLVLFHFSGFDPQRPDELSRYQDRTSIDKDPALGALVKQYCERLARGREWADSLEAPVRRTRDMPLAPASDAPIAPPMPENAWKAQITCAAEMGGLEVTEELVIPVTVRNASAVTWPAGRPGLVGGVALSWHLLDGQGQVLVFDNPRFFFSADLAPGASETIEVTLRAPAIGGHYYLEFDLVQEGVAWFAQTGSATARVWLRVSIVGQPTPQA